MGIRHISKSPATRVKIHRAVKMDNFDRISDEMIVALYNRCQFQKTGQTPEFTQEEVVSLKLAWNNWVAGDPAKKGFELFLRMFKDRPETQKVFEFARGSSSAQMVNSSRLFFHVTRVVNKIGKCVENLDSLEECVPMLMQLGSRHGEKGYNVPSHYFPHLGKALRALMKETVKPYNDHLDSAWGILYDWIISILVSGQEKYGKKDA